jgi:hypothetical protein
MMGWGDVLATGVVIIVGMAVLAAMAWWWGS